MTKNGVALIADERTEQLKKHGFDANRDAQYTNNELVDAAMQYLGTDDISCWPETWDKQWYKPGNRIEELKRAGALIAAEIDRILEAEPKAHPDAWKNITSMAAVYKFHGLEDGYVPDLSGFPEFMRGYKAAEFKAQLMAAAINGDWVADWSNTNQRKYYPWWRVSGRGRSLGGVGYDAALARVGPRLCFESDEKVCHAVKYFTPIIEDHYFTV